MVRWLDAVLPAPPARPRVRPPDLLHGEDDRPPARVVAAVALQHAGLALMMCIYAVLAGSGAGLHGGALVAHVSTTILILGVVTFLSSLRSRFTPGMLLVSIPGPIALGMFVAIARRHGLGAVMGAGIVVHLAFLAGAGLLPRLRKVFPPEVVGVVLLMLGLSLVGDGVSRSVGLVDSAEVSARAMATSGATLAMIVACSIWGSPRVKLGAMFAGALLGAAVGVALGQVAPDARARLAELSWTARPAVGLALPRPSLVPGAIAATFVTQLIALMDVVASALAIDRINDAHWRRADMDAAGRAVFAWSTGGLLAAATATLPPGPSTANIGLVHATGISSRVVGIATAALLVAVAFFPRASLVIALAPGPVSGAILVYTAAYMIVVGMELVLSRMMNERRMFTVGLSVALGTAVLVLPRLVDAAPEWSRVIVESGLAVASIAAVGLHLLFRIGIARTVELALPEDGAAGAIATFLERCGTDWGARREVVQRAGIACGEAVEVLRERGLPAEGTLSASFDEFSLVCTLRHAGPALALAAAEGDEPPLDAAGEIDIDAAMRRASHALLTRLADRVRVAEGAGTAAITLVFEH